MNTLGLVLLGLFAGTLSGFLGIGGGLIMIPALVYLFGYSQHLAQGTSLAVMVLPIGLLAAYRYWLSGHVHIPTALWICAGFFLGGFLGAHAAHGLSALAMRRAFGIFLFLVSIRMVIGR